MSRPQVESFVERAYRLGAAEDTIALKWRRSNGIELLQYLVALGVIEYNGTGPGLKIHSVKLKYLALAVYAPHLKLHYDLAHVGAAR